MEVDLADPAKAAIIIFQKIRPALIGEKSNPQKVLTTIEPIRGFFWSKNLIRQTTTVPINDFMHCLKGAAVPKDTIDEFSRMFKEAFERTGVAIPEGWDIWRTLITQYNLHEIRPFALWAETVSSLGDRFVRTPFDLAVLTFSEISALDTTLSPQGFLILLWQSSLCWKETYQKHPSLFGERHEQNVRKITKQLRTDSVKQTGFYKDWINTGAHIGLPKGFEEQRPNEQMRLLTISGADPASTEYFLRMGAKVNALRLVNGSIRCVSSGINSCVSFSTLMGRPLSRLWRVQSSFGDPSSVRVAPIATTRVTSRRPVSSRGTPWTG